MAKFVNLMSGIPMNLFDQSFIQGNLIERKSFLKDVESLCAVKGHQFIVGIDRTKPKIFEMHLTHAVNTIGVKSFQIVRNNNHTFVYEVESREKRDEWVKILLSSLKSSKESLGTHINWMSMNIGESMEEDNRKEMLTKANSLIDSMYTVNDSKYPDHKSVKVSSSKSFGSKSVNKFVNHHHHLKRQDAVGEMEHKFCEIFTSNEENYLKPETSPSMLSTTSRLISQDSFDEICCQNSSLFTWSSTSSESASTPCSHYDTSDPEELSVSYPNVVRGTPAGIASVVHDFKQHLNDL